MLKAEESTISTLRRSIAGSKVMPRLLQYIEAEPEEAPNIMTPDQAKNAQLLINKVLPTLQIQTIQAQLEVNVAHRELSRDQIKSRLIDLDAKRLRKTGT